MSDFPQIGRVLGTFFNVDHGLSEDVAIRLFQRALASGENREALEGELNQAFADKQISWKKLLLNDDYEVFDAAPGVEAREYAHKILWVPTFGP